MKESTALVYIEDRNIKNRLLQTLVSNKIKFQEASDEQDFEYKLKLFDQSIDIILLDTKEENIQDKFNLIKDAKKICNNTELKVLALLHKYKAIYIDQALRAKINDLMIMPFNDNDFIKKIKSLKNNKESLEILPEGYMQRINNEINRAKRGGYPLSLILTEIPGLNTEEAQGFEKSLKKTLRNTDNIIKWDVKQYLIMCPFTKKTQINIVENKVRKAYQIISSMRTIQKHFYLYGVTFPVDGEDFNSLQNKLIDGIKDSMVIDSINEPLSTMDKEKLRSYIDRLKINNYNKKV